LAQHRVNQRRLAMVNVRDNRNISNVVSFHSTQQSVVSSQ
jgi:hypothetical protein